jgi:biopolymer transport protein TolR
MATHVRRLTVRPATRPNSDINITPLVDVVLVLLIIFMVVTPLLEKDIGVRVPATEQVEQHDEVPPDQLVVRIDAAGELTINDEKVPRAEYIDRLQTILSRKGPNDKLVFMVADDATNYGNLLTIIDGAKQAGAEVIGMATQLPDVPATAQPGAAPAPAPAPEPAKP